MSTVFKRGQPCFYQANAKMNRFREVIFVDSYEKPAAIRVRDDVGDMIVRPEQIFTGQQVSDWEKSNYSNNNKDLIEAVGDSQDSFKEIAAKLGVKTNKIVSKVCKLMRLKIIPDCDRTGKNTSRY